MKILSTLLTALLCAVLLGAARADTKKWDGGAGTDKWGDASNWDPDGVPTGADDVIFDNTFIAGSFTVILDGSIARACRSLQIGYSGNVNTIGLALSGTTANLLTIGGTASNDLIIDDGGVLTNNGNPGSGNRTLLFNSSSDVWQMLGGGKYIHNQISGSFPNSSSGTITRSFASTTTVEYQTSNGFTSTIAYGNLTINAASATVNPGTSSMTINGNLTVQNGTFRGTTSGTPTHTIGGSIDITGGTFNGTSGSGSPVFNIGGSLNQTAGTYTASASTGVPTINFSGSGLGALNLSGTVSNSLHTITIGASRTITLQSALPVAMGGSIIVNGGLNCGTNIVSGTGNFTLASEAELGIGSIDGIAASGATGNIQVSGTRTFSTDAHYVYNGNAAQQTGDGLPGTVNSLTVDNGAGVTLSNSTMVNTTLVLANGIITTGANVLTVGLSGSISGGSSSSYVDGKLARIYSSTGSKSFPIGKGGNYRPLTLNFTALTGTSTVIAEQFESGFPGIAPAGTALLGSRYWNVTQTGASGFTYDVTLDGSDLTPTGSVRLIKHDGGTTVAFPTTTPNYTASGLTTLSDFALGEEVISTFLITASAGEKGAVSPSGSVSVASGSDQTFTITPDPGYHIVDVVVDGSSVGAVATYTFSNVTADHTITASFAVNCASPSIISGPEDQTRCAGNEVSFSASASGDPSPAVQWQVSTDEGGLFSDIPGATSTTLSFTPSALDNGKLYRAVFTNDCANATSDAARLTVNTEPVVTTTPTDQTVLAGTDASFSAGASGTPIPTVHWQVSTNGGTSWSDISSATATTLAVSSVSPSQNGYKYRAVFSNTCGTATSPSATLIVKPSALLKVQFLVHILLDNTCRPKIRNMPVADAEVRVYTMGDVCTENLVVSGKPKIWGKIFDGPLGPSDPDAGCPIVAVGSYVAKGVTDANGEVRIVVPPTTTNPNTDYIVIGSTLSFDDMRSGEEPDALYSGDRVRNLRAGEQKIVKLRRLRLFSGKIVPAKYLEEYGSYLAIIEPEYMDWESDQEQYPFVLEGEGDWSVTTSIEPPEGFVSDYSRLSAEIDDTTAAIQFTLTDMGSDWSATSVKHEIKHKGKFTVRGSTVPMFDKKKGKRDDRGKGNDKRGGNDKGKGEGRPGALRDGEMSLTTTPIPEEYALYQAYPDPFNPMTTIRFDLPKASVVTVKVYDVLGRELATLVDGEYRDAGRYEVRFSATGPSGSGGDASGLGSGVYFYRISAGPFTDVKRMVLLK